MFVPDKGRLRLRQRGTVLSLSRTFGSKSQMFVKKNWDFLLGMSHPAAGEIPRQTRDRLTHISIGRFAVFAHFVLFMVQTPTA